MFILSYISINLLRKTMKKNKIEKGKEKCICNQHYISVWILIPKCNKVCNYLSIDKDKCIYLWDVHLRKEQNVPSEARKQTLIHKIAIKKANLLKGLKAKINYIR